MNSVINWVGSWTNGGVYAIAFFIPFALCLLYASLKIVRFSQVIIAKTKLGGGFFGGAVIALVTSVPELITEIQQASSGTPANGLGDDIGSNLFSVFLIAVAAFISFKFMFLNNIGKGTKISIIFSFIVTTTLSIFLIIGKDLHLGTIGLMPMIIFVFYLFSLFLFYKHGDEDTEESYPNYVKRYSIKTASLLFVFWALVVIVFAVLINITVSSFQKGTGIKSESAGGILLAITTSLPEVVAFFAFLKKKQPVAAIASLVGSHFFNLGILFFGDLAYTAGPTFNVPEVHNQYPMAIMLSSMLLLLLVHFGIAKKFPKLANNRKFYFIIPSIVIIGYFIGWTLILIYN